MLVALSHVLIRLLSTLTFFFFYLIHYECKLSHFFFVYIYNFFLPPKKKSHILSCLLYTNNFQVKFFSNLSFYKWYKDFNKNIQFYTSLGFLFPFNQMFIWYQMFMFNDAKGPNQVDLLVERKKKKKKKKKRKYLPFW